MLLLQRERRGLEPLMERDLVAERRVRTVLVRLRGFLPLLITAANTALHR